MDIKSLFRVKPISKILASPEETGHPVLERNLNVRDLTGFGIAAVIGGGIFSSIGQVLHVGGPGASLLYVFTALVCLLSALCYAQFASTIPVAGSAYTYSYAVFGELIAWIIGWDLLMEYAIGNIAVAISWSDYFTGLWNGLASASFQFPAWLSMDYVSAHKAFDSLATNGITDGANAWINAPQIAGLRIICDLPALFITVAITWLVFVGIKESKRISNLFVLLKLLIIFLVIVAGSFYVKPENWSPFAPNGVGGILKGISGVFFAYIGFDAISTTAEECKEPERDLPRSMIYALAICTVIYVLVTLVLSGMVNYSVIGGGDPMAEAFRNIGTPLTDKLAGIIAIGAVIAMASVFLVFQLGQPRIWMSMSRDGLLPPIFSRIHPKYKTPSFSTLLAGLMVGIPALFLNLQEVIDLTSIGTLFAFALVSAGIIIMDKKDIKPKFKVPHLNSRIWFPAIVVVVIAIAAIAGQLGNIQSGIKSYGNYLTDFTSVTAVTTVKEVSTLTDSSAKSRVLYHDELSEKGAQLFLLKNPSDTVVANLAELYDDSKETGIKTYIITKNEFSESRVVTKFDVFRTKAPEYLFLIILVIILVFTFIRNWSLIPILALISNLFLMSQLGHTNWERFFIWLGIGLVLYFAYGYRNSKLAKEA